MKSAVDDLIELNYKDRPKLIADFAKILSATETSLNEGIGSWLNGMFLEETDKFNAELIKFAQW